MDSWNRAVAQIEQQIADGAAHRSSGEVDVASLARITLTSEYHFRRMFSVLAGMPVSDYIRRRRMTLSASAVLGGDTALQDVAVRYGYRSADAFSRAFRAVHGIGPAQARGKQAALRSQPQLRFSLNVKGTEPMDYRIEQREAFTLVGRRRRMQIIYHGPNPEMEDFVEELGYPVLADISARSNRDPSGVLSVSTAFDEGREDGSTFEFWMAAATDGSDPGTYETLEVPALNWLVLRSQSMEIEEIQQLWPKAYAEWLPANPYEVVNAPELLATIHDDDGNEHHAELWLAVQSTG